MKRSLAILMALAMLLGLAACGGAAPAGAKTESVAYSSAGAYDADYEAYDGSYGLAAAAYPSEDAAERGSGGDQIPEEDPQKIIYSAEVTVESTEFDKAVSQVEELVRSFGGRIDSSSVTGVNYSDLSRGNSRSRSASFLLRVPSGRFQELMGSLSTLGNIPYSHSYTENVTAQYYDVEARVRAYTAQEQRLVEMMALAETVEDVIVLEDRLTELRYRIDSLQSSLNNWDRQVSYSSIQLKLNEVRDYTPEPEEELSYGQELLRSFRSGFAGLGSFFKGLLLFLAAAAPTLVLLALLGYGLYRLLRASAPRRQARRQRRAEKRAEKLARRQARGAVRNAPPAEPGADADMDK